MRIGIIVSAKRGLFNFNYRSFLQALGLFVTFVFDLLNFHRTLLNGLLERLGQIDFVLLGYFLLEVQNIHQLLFDALFLVFVVRPNDTTVWFLRTRGAA
jgi:hypothetical protein